MRLAVALLLVACGSDPAPATDPDPCARVADGVRAIWDKQAHDAKTGSDRKAAEDMRHKLAGRLERHCRDDGWSVEAIDCVRAGNPCRGKLAPDQQHKLDADKPD